MTASELAVVDFEQATTRCARVIVMHPDPQQRRLIGNVLAGGDGNAEFLQFDRISAARRALETSTVDLIVTAALLDDSTVFVLLDAVLASRQSPRIVITGPLQGRMKTAIRAYAFEKRLYDIAFAEDARKIISQKSALSASEDAIPTASSSHHAISKGELFRAFESGAIEAVIQPQYCLKNGAIVGAELLARWRHPSGRLLSPNVFLPLVSQWEWDLKLADAMLAAVSEVHTGMTRVACCTPLRFAINVSATAIQSAACAEVLNDLVQLHGLNNRLVLEITEDGDDDCNNRLAGAVGHWRLKGYDCAIDDFGKDGSSYRRLLTVPFNVLKLDCALLWQARQGNDSEQTLLAREKLGRMVELAHSMDMLTIAEGIETTQDYDVARAVGCHIGQGYLLSKPLTIPDFIARLTH